MHRLTSQVVTTQEQLRAVIGVPTPVVQQKVATRLNALTRRFIEASPLVCLSTSDAEGRCDVSPRGDPRGFVRILDDVTLLMPERPGNKLADSLSNVLENPRVGLLFVIPGVHDCFRVNGRATVTTDAVLLAPSTLEGKAPRLGLIIDVEQAYTQCAKAFLRGDVWNPSLFVDRAQLPSNGQIHEVLCEGFDGARYDEERAARYARREGFY